MVIKLCVSKLCVNMLCVNMLCVRNGTGRAMAGGSGQAEVHNQKIPKTRTPHKDVGNNVLNSTAM